MIFLGAEVCFWWLQKPVRKSNVILKNFTFNVSFTGRLLHFMLITPFLKFSVPVILSFARHRGAKGHGSKTLTMKVPKIRASAVPTLVHRIVNNDFRTLQFCLHWHCLASSLRVRKKMIILNNREATLL